MRIHEFRAKYFFGTQPQNRLLIVPTPAFNENFSPKTRCKAKDELNCLGSAKAKT